jgi:hypothetical protein
MKTIAALLIVLGLASVTEAQVSSLQGRAVRWGTNEPIAKVSVELQRNDNAPFIATTNGDGVFVFPNVPSGQYRVTASRAGYVSAEYGQRWPNGAGRPLTLPAGQAVSNVPIPLLQTGAINGSVRDALGNPLGAVDVQALKASYQTGRRVLTPVQSVVSDDRGDYRLFWLTPGKYYIVARHPQIAASPMRVGGIMVGGAGVPGRGGVPRYQAFRSGGDNASAAAIIMPGVDPDRAPKEKYMAVYYPGTTDEFAATAVDVAPGGELRAIDFTVAPMALRRVRGRVVYESNNEPAMSATVQSITSSGSSPSDTDGFLGPRAGATAVQCCDGTFELGLPQGAYTLVAAVDNLTARVGLNVGDSDIDGVVFGIGRRFNLRGTVTFEGRTPSAAELSALRLSLPIDPPIPGLLVGGYSNVLPNGTFTLPAGRGDFRLNIVPLLSLPGVFNVPGPAPPATLAGAYVKSARLGDIDVLNNTVHLDGDPQQPLEIVIATATGTLEGSVISRERQPVPNVAVVLVPDVARRRRTDLIKSTSADASGRFHFDRLPPGDYVAFAIDGPAADGEWQNPEYLAAHESAGAIVRIAVGGATTVELIALTE